MDGRVAIVGGGLGGFTAYATLLHGGVHPSEIDVFDPDPNPVGTWRPRAEAIRQQRMRSESDGHCYPESFPGLAPREAVRRRSLAPLLRTVANAYRPTVDEFRRHVDELRWRLGWDDRIRRVARSSGSRAATGFELDGAGVFRHVLLAPGHPGLVLPPELDDDPRVVHAYEPHDYARTCRRRRRRDGRGDGVAERTRRPAPRSSRCAAASPSADR